MSVQGELFTCSVMVGNNQSPNQYEGFEIMLLEGVEDRWSMMLLEIMVQERHQKVELVRLLAAKEQKTEGKGRLKCEWVIVQMCLVGPGIRGKVSSRMEGKCVHGTMVDFLEGRKETAS